MKSLSCILLLIERNDLVHRGLSKALVLARHAGARLELLLCDSERHLAFRPGNAQAAARRPTGLAEDEQYLQALRQYVVSPDVQIHCEASRAASLTEALSDKLRRTPAQIVVKPVRSGPPMASHIDWALATQCEVPLLLTDGRPWRPVPRFAAAVELSAEDDPLCRQIVALCETLSHSCGARLDYLDANASRGRGINVSAARRRLEALRREWDASGPELRHWTTEPGEILPRVVAPQDYDLLALGVRPEVSEDARSKETRPVTVGPLSASPGDVLLIGRAPLEGGRVGLDPSGALAPTTVTR